MKIKKMHEFPAPLSDFPADVIDLVSHSALSSKALNETPRLGGIGSFLINNVTHVKLLSLIFIARKFASFNR